MDQGLRPEERIRKKTDFSFLYRNGNRHRGRYFNLVFFPNSLSHSRMAVVVSKKVGNAVVRNKVKRRLRDVYRRNKDVFKETMDLLIIARPEIRDIPMSDLRTYYLEAVASLPAAKKK